jgi:hypothetical protein
LPPIRTTSATQDEFGDENINSNLVKNHTAQPHKFTPLVNNSLNVAAPPFYAAKSSLKESVTKETNENLNFSETLKRTRSGNAAGSMRVVNDVNNNNKVNVELGVPVPGSKARRLSFEKNKLCDMLPDTKDFEDAILSAIFAPSNELENENATTSGICSKKVDKRRLKVFQDITLSLSPKAKA